MNQQGPNPTFRIRTLGCRVNHAESREIESLLLSRGLEPAGNAMPADLEVVHTCAVTSQAAAKSRHAIRRASRSHPGHSPHVLVTGCWVSADPDAAAELGGSSLNTIGHRDPDDAPMMERLAGRLDSWLASEPMDSPPAVEDPPKTWSSNSVLPLKVIAPPTRPGRHARAEVRIQDGCDAHCTFCIIPSLRPTLRSKTVKDVIEETTRLVDLGHREVVLAGIFLGAYGHETALRRRQSHPESEPLADLLDAVASVPGLIRLRLSSLEPGDMTGPLLDAMVANRPVVVPHLHLPLQSGSDAILRRMNRQYRVGDYLDMVAMVDEALVDDVGLPPAITTDIICGFPGETDEDFQETIDVAEATGFLHMHVFPFSPRAGTAAARWKDQFVPDPLIRTRVRHLIDLEEDPEDGLSIRWRRRLLGRSVRVILEQEDPASPGTMTGRCDHYAMVHVAADRPRNSVVRARVTHVGPTRTAGQLIDIDQYLPVLASTLEMSR